jgi:cytochrome P450
MQERQVQDPPADGVLHGRDWFNDFDVEDPRFGENLEEILDEMVQKCPVGRSNVGNGYWTVNRHEDVRKCGQDWKTFSSAHGYMMNRPDGVTTILPEESDPPYHNTWRRALNPYFAPGVVSAIEDDARKYANELIDGIIDAGETEFIPDYGGKLPGLVLFKHVIPVPVDDIPMLFSVLDKSTWGPLEERAGAFEEVHQYCREFLKRRAEEPPRGDVIDAIVEGVVREAGSRTPDRVQEEEAPASFDDKGYILLDLVFGGLVTTTHVMACGMHYLAMNPKARKMLAENPSLVPGAVEEFVRSYPPTVSVAREVMQDVDIAGKGIKKGEIVMLNYAAATRDPSVLDNASEVEIDREPFLQIAFGVGVHRCLGAHLARLNLRITFEEFLRRIPEFEVKPGTAPTYQTGQLRTMSDLHLVFPPGGAAA